MKANKPKKLSRTASSTPDASSPPAAQPVTTTEEQRSGGDDLPVTGQGRSEESGRPTNLPIDVVVWPEAKSAEEAAARVRPAATSLTPEQRAELEAEKLPESDLRTPGASPAATAQPPAKNIVATPKRTSGAGWFIPPQGPSGFGVKKG